MFCFCLFKYIKRISVILAHKIQAPPRDKICLRGLWTTKDATQPAHQRLFIRFEMVVGVITPISIGIPWGMPKLVDYPAWSTFLAKLENVKSKPATGEF